MNRIQGLHHITAVASDPQANVDFYEQVLGQRLIKTTVNFDDPGTYHLYYGDEIGTPGTILTFFPWLHMGRGRAGAGETVTVAYHVPLDSLGFWAEHLERHAVEVTRVGERFGQATLEFADPDGMMLALVASREVTELKHWNSGPIPEKQAIRGFQGVTLRLSSIEATGALLTEQFGYDFVGQENGLYRYKAESDVGAVVDIEHLPNADRGRFGAGSIHHIAFRTVNDDEQKEYQQALRSAGHDVTDVRDRQYFHSIYFREPGGVLFEVATDAPGFLVDEDVASLGSSLKLPPWIEPRREHIEKRLPPIKRRPSSPVSAK